jgi:hypothetical protein
MDVVASNYANATHDPVTKPSQKKHKSEVTSDTTFITGATTEQKRRAKGKPKVGQLEGLLSVPMDVLFEVNFCLSRFNVGGSLSYCVDIWSFAPT